MQLVERTFLVANTSTSDNVVDETPGDVQEFRGLRLVLPRSQRAQYGIALQLRERFSWFGLWGLLAGKIGMASATVSAVALGIVVDDSVHFLSKYLRARREIGLAKAEAIKYAFETVGLALVVTTIILTFGFLVMALSTFQMNQQLGMMTAVTMVLALIIDFTLLPALLLIGKQESTPVTEDNPQPASAG